MAVDTEKGIYYDTLQNQAYVNLPPTSAANMSGCLDNFEIKRFYVFQRDRVPDVVEQSAQRRAVLTVAEDMLGGIPGVRLSSARTIPTRG